MANTEDIASRNQAIRDRVNAGIALAKARRPEGYDWGRAGRGDGSPEAVKADTAEALFEDRIAEFVSSGDEAGLKPAFNAWLKALEA